MENKFNLDDLKIGDVFYTIVDTNNAFSRKKIFKIIDGEEWFKYDKPLRTYRVAENKVVGILRMTLEGLWYEDYDFTPTEYYIEQKIENVNEKHYILSDHFFEDFDEIFVDKSAAMVYKETMELNDKELEAK
jgi:hypothetical protein